ncbi:MAG: hypothetical protein HOQ05_13325 [Corynebacteriales bacterium]|nr:hypothetical protein [Mycobacteriales bacterium]
MPAWIMSILMVVRGFCYPLVTDRETLSKSWGGPTMLGAWAAHFAVGLLCLVGVMIFLKILAKAQRRLARRYLAAQ